MSTRDTDASRIRPDLFPSHQIAIIGQRVIDFWPLLARKHPTVVAMCEGGEEVEAFGGEGATIISPERSDPHRRQWTNRSVGELAARAIPALDRALSESTNGFVVFPYSSTLELEGFGHRRAITVAAIDAALKTRLDDKIRTRLRLKALGLDVPDHVIVTGSIPSYLELSRRLGTRFIFQKRVGSAGIGTYDISSDADLEALRPLLGKDSWLASEHAGDTTVNIHGLVASGVEVSLPSVQLSGVPELVGISHGYCGNDFNAVADLPHRMVNSCRALATSVGAWLKEEGYVGIFGVDLACDENQARILEVNPRLQGSSWLLADVEERSGRTPLIIKHVFAYLGIDPPGDADADLVSNAAQGILHLQSDSPRYVSHRLRCGTYELGQDNNLVFRRRPAWPLILSSSEIFLFGLPPANAIIDSGAVSARFACSGQIADATGRHLTPNGLSIVEAIQRGIAHRPLTSPRVRETR